MTVYSAKQAVPRNAEACSNEYLPRPVSIEKIKDLNGDVRLFTLKFKDGKSFVYQPGQFVQVSIFGAGEAPISITSSYECGEPLGIAVRRVGSVTNALHELKVGDEIFIRGPYGNTFPWKEFSAKGGSASGGKGKDILFIAGGIGLLPLRSVIKCVLKNRKDYGKVWLLYGSRCPADCVYGDEMEQWAKESNVNLLLTVDSPAEGWKGNVGVVTTLFGQVEFNPENTKAYLCGPPIMIKFTNLTLEEKGMTPDDVITTMEMHMKCGIGKCGHCIVGHKYCCTDGPVFTYAQLKELGAEE